MNFWFIALLTAAGCLYALSQVKTTTPVNQSSVIQTISHDGHQFVTWKDGAAGGIIHHPGCK